MSNFIILCICLVGNIITFIIGIGCYHLIPQMGWISHIGGCLWAIMLLIFSGGIGWVYWKEEKDACIK